MQKLGRFGIFIAIASVGAMALAARADAATISPTVFFDGLNNTGNCTLREAVQASNLNEQVDECAAGEASERDTIELAAGEYRLTIDGDVDDTNATGDLDVIPEIGSGPLRIRGKGIDVTTIDAEHDDRVIQLTSLNVRGSLTVSDLTALGNEDRVLSGGVIAANQGKLTIERVEAAEGAAQFGGGISCGSCDKVRITDSIVHDNQAIVSSTGFPGVEAQGGGITVSDEDSVIKNTSVFDNEAVANDSVAIGGGIYGRGEIKIKSSFIASNQARSSTNNAISTRAGGGVYLDDNFEPSSAEIVNTTFSGNVASGSGATSQGGALAVAGESVVNVFATTLEGNDATQGEEVQAQNGASVNVGGSILASIGNGPICAQDGGTIRSKGHNVLDVQPPPVAACMDGPKSAKDKIAEPSLSFSPSDHGGPTFTYAIADSSPAVDLVPKRKCKQTGGEDQRRLERPAGKACDAGSYERITCRGALIDGDSILGTPRSEKLIGTAGPDVFAPSSGKDKLVGGAEDDTLCGGNGDDRLKGGEGADDLDGGKGKDDCAGGPGNDSGSSCEKKKSL